MRGGRASGLRACSRPFRTCAPVYVYPRRERSGRGGAVQKGRSYAMLHMLMLENEAEAGARLRAGGMTVTELPGEGESHRMSPRR